MSSYYSFNTRRNAFTNINNNFPTAPAPHHHKLHNSIQKRNIINLRRRGVTSSINHLIYKKPRSTNNS